MSTAKDKQRENDRKMGIMLAGVFVAAVLIFGGGAYLFTRAFAGHVGSVDEYQTMQLTSANYSSELEAVGTFQSGDTTTVRSEVDGTVIGVAVSEGDKVKKGDTLFTLENEEITTDVSTTLAAYVDAQDEESNAKEQVSSGKAKLSKAKKALTKAQNSLERARAKAEAQAEAYGDEEGSSVEVDFDEEPYQAAIDSAQSTVDSAQDALEVLQDNKKKAAQATEAAKVAYKKAVKKESKLTVKATADGTIAALAIEKGAAVSAASNDAAMKIVDIDDIVAQVEVPENQIANISKGLTATVTCTALDGVQCAATVTHVADTPVDASQDAASGSTQDGTQDSDTGEEVGSDGAMYLVTLKLDNLDSAVKIGMSASAKIVVQDYGTVFYVPASCVAANNAGTYVEAVVDNSTVKQYSVTQLGTADDGQLIIQGASLMDGTVIRTDLSSS